MKEQVQEIAIQLAVIRHNAQPLFTRRPQVDTWGLFKSPRPG